MKEKKSIPEQNKQLSEEITAMEQALTMSPEEIQRVLYEKRERLKELGAINKVTTILREDRAISEMLQQIVEVLPPAWQYPEDTRARIRYGGDEYLCCARFRESRWFQRKTFETIDGKEGTLEVFYLSQHDELDEGPFMMEERNLINNLAGLITGYLNTHIGKALVKAGRA
jgi:hypothetical protein